MGTINRQWLLRRRPQGIATTEDFEYREMEISITQDLAPGELLLRNRVFLCAPTMRNWMNPPADNLYPSMSLGDPVMAPAGCEVIASNRPGVAPGTLVTTFASWQDYQRMGASHAVAQLPAGVDLLDAMGVLGVNTLTAYFGVLRVGRPRRGDTLVVSGAAGSTGSMAAQIGKMQGCRVIGITGGAAKCRWLLDELKLDGAVDYKAGDLIQQLRDACPKGIDVFYDNVGGEILQAAVEVMNRKGRIVLCGQIAGYNDAQPTTGLRNMMRLVYGSITVQGFLQRDYADEVPAASAELRTWFAAGKLNARVDARPGFMQIPQTFSALFRGENAGTLLALVD